MINHKDARTAADWMGLNLDTLTYAQLSTAYRAQAKLCHPDAPTGSVEAWRTLKRAHDRLGAFLRQTKTPLRATGDCKRCGGTGRVGTKPVRWCPACRGAGVVNTAKAR